MNNIVIGRRNETNARNDEQIEQLVGDINYGTYYLVYLLFIMVRKETKG